MLRYVDLVVVRSLSERKIYTSCKGDGRVPETYCPVRNNPYSSDVHPFLLP